MQPKLSRALLLIVLNAISLACFSQWSFIESLKPAVSGFYTGQMPNGNILIMGADAGVGLFQADTTGNIQAYKKVNSQRFRFDNSGSAVKIPDNHFIVAAPGYDMDSSRYFLGVFRVDSQLNVDKFRYIVVQNDGVTQTSITQTKDSGFIITAGAHFSDPSLNTSYILRLDSSLNIVWANHVISTNLVLNSGMEDQAGSLFLVGEVTGVGAVKTFIAKCDGSGNFISAKYFQLNSTAQYTTPQNVFPDNDSLFVVSGSTNVAGGSLKGFAVKIGSDLNVKWAKQYADGGFMLFKAGNDKYGAVGDFYAGSHDLGSFFVMTTDTAGTPNWRKEVSKPSSYMLRHFGNILYRDSTFYFTGGAYTANSTPGTLYTKFRIEIQPCYTSDGLLTVQDAPLVFADMDNPAVTAITDFYNDTLSVSSDSYGTYVYCNALVPLQLLNFSGKANGSSNLLSWQTANEINTAYFDVERSGDSRHFTAIGNVKAESTNKVANNYSYNDASPLSGTTNYYRLKMVDKDGQFTYSKTISLNNKGGSFATLIYPNPANAKLSLQFNSATTARVTIEIFDLGGKTVLRKYCNAAAGVSSSTVDIKSLAAGMYLVRVSNGENKTATMLKFIKQ